HQDYREPAMPESLALVRALRADGVPAIVSGAGPTVLAFTSRGDSAAVVGRCPVGWQAHRLAVDAEGAVLR
ncbi:MAG TPA: homoserine kinase, partial [Nocardioides sp.]